MKPRAKEKLVNQHVDKAGRNFHLNRSALQRDMEGALGEISLVVMEIKDTGSWVLFLMCLPEVCHTACFLWLLKRACPVFDIWLHNMTLSSLGTVKTSPPLVWLCLSCAFLRSMRHGCWAERCLGFAWSTHSDSCQSLLCSLIPPNLEPSDTSHSHTLRPCSPRRRLEKPEQARKGWDSMLRHTTLAWERGLCLPPHSVRSVCFLTQSKQKALNETIPCGTLWQMLSLEAPA